MLGWRLRLDKLPLWVIHATLSQTLKVKKRLTQYSLLWTKRQTPFSSHLVFIFKKHIQSCIHYPWNPGDNYVGWPWPFWAGHGKSLSHPCPHTGDSFVRLSIHPLTDLQTREHLSTALWHCAMSHSLGPEGGYQGYASAVSACPEAADGHILHYFQTSGFRSKIHYPLFYPPQSLKVRTS